jgi:hypothetical protein
MIRLKNMARLGGNPFQRPRCSYFGTRLLLACKHNPGRRLRHRVNRLGGECHLRLKVDQNERVVFWGEQQLPGVALAGDWEMRRKRNLSQATASRIGQPLNASSTAAK